MMLSIEAFFLYKIGLTLLSNNMDNLINPFGYDFGFDFVYRVAKRDRQKIRDVACIMMLWDKGVGCSLNTS